jgi:hypothetical protein
VPIVATEIWLFRARTPADSYLGWGEDLSGFGVEALDGSIGKVDGTAYDIDGGYIVVDTGPWIFGRKVMLPAGVIDRLDPDEKRVYVHRTKDEIKSAPEFDDSLERDESYRDEVGSYYGKGGAGHREHDSLRLK